MNGILIVDKPVGLTSHDVVMRVRRALGTKRVGHTGTLDPFATGVMVLLIGNATRLAQFLDKDEKEYEALVQFGYETDTGDVTGTKKAESEMHADDVVRSLAAINWEKVLSKFRGEMMQTPPMYSAKKIDGKKLYDLARAGVEVERAPARVVVRELDPLPSLSSDSQTAARIRVVCSAGTYIRTLAEDIGREIGLGAHLTELRRTRAGRFTLSDAIYLDALQNEADPAQRLRPVSDAVDHLPALTLSEDRVDKTRSGLSTRTDGEGFREGVPVRMVDEDSNLIAIGTFDRANKTVKPKIVLV